jgi:hypothetical protein
LNGENLLGAGLITFILLITGSSNNSSYNQGIPISNNSIRKTGASKSSRIHEMGNR